VLSFHFFLHLFLTPAGVSASQLRRANALPSCDSGGREGLPPPGSQADDPEQYPNAEGAAFLVPIGRTGRFVAVLFDGPGDLVLGVHVFCSSARGLVIQSCECDCARIDPTEIVILTFTLPGGSGQVNQNHT
jgi:hypothetical protein